MISFDFTGTQSFITQEEVLEFMNKNKEFLLNKIRLAASEKEGLGWVEPLNICDKEALKAIEEKANLIREKADVFVVIGVGGSNQGSRAVLEALGDDKVKILYAGNTLSPTSISRTLSQLKGKSVYVNVIAKNFATLEPGAVFRTIRKYMEAEYGETEAAERIIATCSMVNGKFEKLSRQKGYTVLPFPINIAGRFSVLSAVGLLPIAVGGIDIHMLLKGADDIKENIFNSSIESNIAANYAVYRNLLMGKGYFIEILSLFEPSLYWLSKWWIQLFGESEGKNGNGVFPVQCTYSEDLHSTGQYLQDGRRALFETFINLEKQMRCIIPCEKNSTDGFSYVDGLDFAYLNQVAYEATIKAHISGGVPCLVINIPELTTYYMGQLFYFFEYACYLSASLLGVNPFDQPGVEAYKKNMFKSLGREKS